MSPKLWRERIIEAVQDIADEKFQKSAWFAKSEEISSPEEVYSRLFDDFIFDEFLESDEVGLTADQKQKGRYLVEAMNAYPENSSNLPSPEVVIDDPQWKRIREVAQDFLNSLNNELY